ncbi:MAG: urea ABC transporter permease subunit UrtC [Tepidisphaeraceae bacterium]|jgi:urea transport system permease protein
MPDSTAATIPAKASSESDLAYRASQTFLAKMPAYGVRQLRIWTVGSLLVLFCIVVPLLCVRGVVPDYKVSLLGKYLSLALVALGIDLIWGYTGILSLCQALFFCMGGYAMAMHLSLPQGGGDVRPEYHNIPQFMFFNNVYELPVFWRPFSSLAFAIGAGILLPGILAAVFGFFIFRSRVKGVYFSIVTQAVAWGAWLLICRNEMLLGGTNGLTNFSKPLTQQRGWILSLYLLTLTVLVVAYLFCWMMTNSRLGRVLLAVRDRETRLYFAGYRPYAFKVFAFTLAAVLAGLGGMLYSPQVTMISPDNMKVQESITMVIWVALGGRGRLWGAIFGSLLVNYMYASLTSDLPTLWPFIQGGMFLGVVLFFPDGIVGLWDSLERCMTAGAGLVRRAAFGVPLLAVAGFILGEGLALTPAWMHAIVYQSPKLGKVELKYVVLLEVLAACAISQGLLARGDNILRKRRPAGSAAAVAVRG